MLFDAFLVDNIPLLLFHAMAQKRVEEVVAVALMEWIEIFVGQAIQVRDAVSRDALPRRRVR